MKKRNILIVGAGPAGLALAIFLKRANQDNNITVLDRRSRNEPIGFGVTIPTNTLDLLNFNGNRFNVMESYIEWSGERYLETDVNFACVDRTNLISSMSKSAIKLGSDILYYASVINLNCINVDDYDLIVGADGTKSVIKSSLLDNIKQNVIVSRTWHAWLSAPKDNSGLATTFKQDESELFLSFMYPYCDELSTFVVECTDKTWHRRNFKERTAHDTLNELSELYNIDLLGTYKSDKPYIKWVRFETISLNTCYHNNIVLIGDAAHTSNYATGFGTQLAIDDAYELANALSTESDISTALNIFDKKRHNTVKQSQMIANSRHNWHVNILSQFENGNDKAVIVALEEAKALLTG